MQSDISCEIDKVIASNHADPFRVLGPHVLEDDPSSIIIRAFLPLADSVRLVSRGRKQYMYKMREEGLFEIIVDNDPQAYEYFFEATSCNNEISIFHDPYRFPVQLSSYDQHLFNKGCHYNIYEKLGAHALEIDHIRGVIFRVWAPNACRVSVIGNFNYWDGRRNQMRVIGSSGIWEIFIPGIGQGEIYKYEIRTGSGNIIEKSDPFQFHGELPPKTASIVWEIDDYQWQDHEWLEERKEGLLHDQALSIYEVHPGSWLRDPANAERYLSFNELADSLIPYVKHMGFTHIELMPIMEHSLIESWGYQSTAYYSVTSRYGIPQDFMYFVDQCHQQNIGVLLDWSPADFPPEGHFLAKFDGTALYEAEETEQDLSPDRQNHHFNFGRREVANYLIANSLFWLDKFHVDGIRVNKVSSMFYKDSSEDLKELNPAKLNVEAIDFIKHLNSIVHQYYSDTVMIAGESSSFYGVTEPVEEEGLGFDFKWNRGWSNDILFYLSRIPQYRKYHHNSLTSPSLYAFSEKHILPLDHNEVVHGKRSLVNKMPGDEWQRFANLRLLYFLFWTQPGKKLLFMGGEIGQGSEWDCQSSLDWHLLEESPFHCSLQHYVEVLNKTYKTYHPLWEMDIDPEGFQWINYNDVDKSIIVYSRFNKDKSDHLICLANMTSQVYYDYKVGVPEQRTYKELLSTDMGEFGGSNIHNPDLKIPVVEPVAEAPYHITIMVPPLAGVILQPETKD